MSLIIPDDIVQAARLTEDELRRELAILLFQQDRVSLGQASRFAGMARLGFQHLLASRGIPVHYTLTDFEDDLATLRTAGRRDHRQRAERVAIRFSSCL